MTVQRRKLPMEELLMVQTVLIDFKKEHGDVKVTYQNLEKFVFKTLPACRNRLAEVTLRRVAKVVGIEFKQTRSRTAVSTGHTEQVRMIAKILLRHLQLDKDEKALLTAIHGRKFADYQEGKSEDSEHGLNFPSLEALERIEESLLQDNNNEPEPVRGVLY